jgi:hypothetical protein
VEASSNRAHVAVERRTRCVDVPGQILYHDEEYMRAPEPGVRREREREREREESAGRTSKPRQISAAISDQPSRTHQSGRGEPDR